MATRYYLKSVLSVAILFAFVYHFINWFNANRSEHYAWFFSWELNAPLIPWTMLLYVSVYVLIVLPCFLLQKEQLKILKREMQLAIIISGCIFLLLPTKLGFIRPDKLDYLDPVFQLMYKMDQEYNLFPSLHITLSMLLILNLVKATGRYTRILFAFWMLGIMVSVITVHQHHLIDIIGGIILSILIHFFMHRHSTEC